MKLIVNLTNYLTYLSYFLPLLVLMMVEKKHVLFRPILLYSLVNILMAIGRVSTAILLKTVYPAFHISTLLSFLSVLYLFHQIGYGKKSLVFFTFSSLLLFLYESVLLGRWFENNEWLTIYTLLSLCVLSVHFLLQQLKKTKEMDFSIPLIFSSVIFLKSASMFVLCIFETELRKSANTSFLVMFFAFNAIEWIHHLGVSMAIWTLRKDRNATVSPVQVHLNEYTSDKRL